MITAKAYAKINWALDILATRENGYHDLDMLMQSISLHDTLTFEEAEEVSLLTNGSPDPYAEKNLVVRAARLLQEISGCTKGARISLTKRTPAMAGLGGGSADCAAALIVLDRMWKLNLSEETLYELGFKLGADVPFCLMGNLVRVGGLGEKLKKLSAPAAPEMLLIMPDGGLSTGAVFKGYDNTERTMPKVDIDGAAQALQRGDYRALDHLAYNVLTEPAAAVSRAVGEAIEQLKENGAVFARMSGSGSAVFGVFENADAAARAQKVLSEKYVFCERITTSPCGVEISEEA